MEKPIHLGLIGCGGIVQKTHARAYHELSGTVKVTALADVVPENLQNVGDQFDVPVTKPMDRLSRNVGKR